MPVGILYICELPYMLPYFVETIICQNASPCTSVYRRPAPFSLPSCSLFLPLYVRYTYMCVSEEPPSACVTQWCNQPSAATCNPTSLTVAACLLATLTALSLCTRATPSHQCSGAWTEYRTEARCSSISAVALWLAAISGRGFDQKSICVAVVPRCWWLICELSSVPCRALIGARYWFSDQWMGPIQCIWERSDVRLRIVGASPCHEDSSVILLFYTYI